jgi:predicted nucleic acid-binding protein
MSALVLDASVVIKWFVPEVHSDAARRLLQDNDQYFAPDMLFAEIGNVAWKKVRRGELSSRDGLQLLKDLMVVPIESVASQFLIHDAFSLANATGRSVYDALYVALAIRLKTRFITADERLFNALTNTAAAGFHVQLLQKAS